MADYPDVFADAFGITASQFGITITLSRTEPTGQPGVREEPKSIVARVRLSPAMAASMAAALSQASTVNMPTPEQAKTTKH